jgi:FtsH-binding integral membrane protein
MKMDTTTEASISRFLRFVRRALGMGLAFAAGLSGVVVVLKWFFGGSDLRDAMIEAVLQGFPLLGFMLGGAVASARALYETTANTAYRVGVGIALGAAFLLVWTVLAVGGIGAGGPPDLMFGGVLTVGIVGAIIARFEPRGMARALFATAIAQVLVPVVALAAGWHRLPGSSVQEILIYCWFFAVLFAGSAWLFLEAAQAQPPASAGLEG